MSEPRLKARLRVQAALRTCTTRGTNATIIRRGDEDAGAILVKQNLMGGGFRVLVQVRDASGEPAWMAGSGPAPVQEGEADAYIARQVERDYDVWVIEIEDREGWIPFLGAIIS